MSSKNLLSFELKKWPHWHAGGGIQMCVVVDAFGSSIMTCIFIMLRESNWRIPFIHMYANSQCIAHRAHMLTWSPVRSHEHNAFDIGHVQNRRWLIVLHVLLHLCVVYVCNILMVYDDYRAPCFCANEWFELRIRYIYRYIFIHAALANCSPSTLFTHLFHLQIHHINICVVWAVFCCVFAMWMRRVSENTRRHARPTDSRPSPQHHN